MAIRKVIQKFDSETFLASVGNGRSSEKYSRRKNIFRQGDGADAVFYIQKGKVQITVVSEPAR
jgi:CRP-like cAMP-binding protein